MNRPMGVAALAGGVLAALVALPAAPAHARPIANDDRYDVVAGGTYSLTPLDNDSSDLDLFYGDEFLCGIQSFDRQRVYVEATGSGVVVEVADGFRGTTAITYALCQDNQPTDTATITLDVVRLADVQAVKVKGVKGRVRFTNPNGATLSISYGNPGAARPDATRPLGRRASMTIPTKRRSIYWVAHIDHEGTIVTVGDGVLTGLQSKK